MAVNFFQKEITNIQKQFNRVFRKRVIHSKDLKEKIILSICWLGMLNEKIIETEDKRASKEMIKAFVAARDTLKHYLSELQKKERSINGKERNNLPTAKAKCRSQTKAAIS